MNARTRRGFEDQHPAVGPGLVGALVPLLKDGERTREGHRRVRRDARGVRKTEGKKKMR